MRSLEMALRVQAARNNVTRVKPRKWPRPRFPTNERLYYYRHLLYVIETVQYLVQRNLLPALPGILGAHNAQRPEATTARTDAADSDIDAAFESLREATQRAIPEPSITLAVQQAALRTTRWNGNELTKQVQQVAKINLFDDTTGLANHLDLFVAENVRLVKSLAADHLEDLKGIVTRAARQGLHHTEVTAQIAGRFDMVKQRAALIATDQIGKLNGELNQLRQQNLGVRRYRWSSSQDERVRKRHRELNGKVYAWNDPPVVDMRTGERGHPGQPIRCRCAAIPIIDDVLVDAGLMDPRDVELQQPTAGAQPSLRPVAPQPGALPPTPPPPPPPPPPVQPPKPLPIVPPAVPQPPPANVPRAAPQAPAAPPPPPSPPPSPPSPPSSSPPSRPTRSLRSVPKGLPQPLPANLGPARQKARTNPKPAKAPLPSQLPVGPKGAKVGVPATPPKLPAAVRPPAWMLEPQPHVTRNPTDVITERGATESEILRIRTPEGEKKAIWKPLNPEKAWTHGVENSEAAAAALDRLFHGKAGAVVPSTVARELGGRRGSLQEIVSGSLGSAKALAREIAEDPGTWANQPSTRKMFLEDVLARSIDRHEENVLFTKSAGGAPIAHAIDNGYAFRTLGEHGRYDPMFAFPVQEPAFVNTLMDLDAVSVATIRAADPAAVAELLLAHDLEPDQVYETLVRLKSLQKEPAQLKALIGESVEDTRLRLSQWLGQPAEAHGLSASEIAELKQLAWSSP